MLRGVVDTVVRLICDTRLSSSCLSVLHTSVFRHKAIGYLEPNRRALDARKKAETISVMITVTGGAEDFYMESHIKDEFAKGGSRLHEVHCSNCTVTL